MESAKITQINSQQHNIAIWGYVSTLTTPQGSKYGRYGAVKNGGRVESK